MAPERHQRPRQWLCLWRMLVLVLTAWRLLETRVHAYPVNHFLGTCLTQDWVQQMEQKLGVNASERDSHGRSKYPYLRKALANSQIHPRFRIDDPRTATSFVFNTSCIEKGSVAIGATGSAFPNNTVIDKGQFNGSLVVQLDGWLSQGVTSSVLEILAGEVLGYAISENWPTNSLLVTQRMSSVGLGVCNPVHVDLEVTTTGFEQVLQVYSNESYRVGTVGYIGGAGIYTTSELVLDGQNASKVRNPFSADFWKDYKISDELLNKFPPSTLWNNPKYWPPADKTACVDGDMGCKNFCSRTYACTLREQAGKTCMLVVMGWSSQQSGFIQSMFSNNGIPAYFCFVGKGQDTTYAAEMVLAHIPVAFLGFKLSGMMNNLRPYFNKVYFPYSTPEKVAMNTGIFGDKGYGNTTSNPVYVDLPDEYLSKYAASLLLNYPPISTLLSRLNLDQSDIYELESNIASVNTTDVHEKYFSGGCLWVRKHYDKWSQWLLPLPLCTADDLQLSCEMATDPLTPDQNVSHVSFTWKNPSPDDARMPYACDGGITSLPAPSVFHFACDELANQSISWFLTRPKCDEHFFVGSVSECDNSAQRTINYRWHLPTQNNSKTSMECDGTLPADDLIDCDYLPIGSAGYVTQVVVVCLVTCVYLVVAALVYHFRQARAIQRAPHANLQLMLLGGLLTLVFVFVQGGKPSCARCSLRLAVWHLGFTLLIGPILIKSYMTYQLSLLKRKQRLHCTRALTRQGYVLLGKVLLVDVALLVCGYAIHFPRSMVLVNEQYSHRAIQTTILDMKCDFGSDVFFMLVLMWKAVTLVFAILFSVLGLSSGVDESGESFWLVGASASVVVIIALWMLLEAGMSLSRNLLFLFENTLTVMFSVLVIGFVFVPKLLLLNWTGVAAAITHQKSMAPTTFTTLKSDESNDTHKGTSDEELVVRPKVKPEAGCKKN